MIYVNRRKSNLIKMWGESIWKILKTSKMRYMYIIFGIRRGQGTGTFFLEKKAIPRFLQSINVSMFASEQCITFGCFYSFWTYFPKELRFRNICFEEKNTGRYSQMEALLSDIKLVLQVLIQMEACFSSTDGIHAE